MTKGITEKEADPRVVYADIIGLPHHESTKHPPMSLYERAAQFSSYKALTGYEDMVVEEARQVDRKQELTDDDLDELNQKLNLLSDSLRDGEKPSAAITYFIPDSRKAGGRYETVTDRIRRIDAARGKVVLERTAGYGNSAVEIDIRDILEIN